MSPRKIGPRCGNLLCLVWSGTSIDEISDFLDQDQELREYFQSNGTFDEKDVLVTECNYPPMHWAAIMGRVDILTLFLEEYDFFPDAREIDKTHSMTPLHWAIMHQHPDCVRVLLKHGSNPNLGGKWRGKRFDSAHSIRRKTNTDICKMLQEVAREPRSLLDIAALKLLKLNPDLEFKSGDLPWNLLEYWKHVVLPHHF